MTQKRKAELQRKLSMAPVPTPPSDLADRIKAGIPHDLRSTQRERERFSRSLAFNLRVAASIILLVTSVFFAIRLLSPEDVAAPLAMRAKKAAAPSPMTETAEVTVTLAEEKRDTDKNVARSEVKDEKLQRRQRMVFADAQEGKENAATGVKGGTVGGVVGGVVDEIESRADAPPPAVAAVPPPPPAPTRQAAAPAVANEAAAVFEEPAAKRAALTMSKSRDLAAQSPRSLFGLSLDAGEFNRLRTLVEGGQTPAAESVNLEALVSHFAGPASPARREIELEAEASQPPLPGDDGWAILRYSVDTLASDTTARAIVATSARLDIDLDERAVAEYRIVTGGNLTASESTLMRDLSATGLIEMRLRPSVRPGSTVATVRLRYRAAADGREQMLVQNVKARDLARSWDSASHRHRLATLGALWAESLKGNKEAEQIARAAARLATEAPDDPRARDLAAAASASSRLRSSGPTGSAR